MYWSDCDGGMSRDYPTSQRHAPDLLWSDAERRLHWADVLIWRSAASAMMKLFLRLNPGRLACRLRNSALIACSLVTIAMVSQSTANATCGEECYGQYSSAIDDCRSQYGDDPADADDLTNCIQEARDDYRSCLDDCASAAISLPRQRSLLANARTVPIVSLCRSL